MLITKWLYNLEVVSNRMSPDQLNATFAALADPTRRAILRRLTSGEATVTQLARPFAVSQPAISKHLRVLEQAGLISRRRSAQRRPCRLEGARLREASKWIDAYRAHWDKNYERLDALLVELKEKEKKHAKRKD
jgi:DNA-binding transcriptional ArsR family regulator